MTEIAPRQFGTSWHHNGRVFVHLEWDDFTSIMDLVWSTMDANSKQDPEAVANALDLVIERLAYLRKWTDPDQWEGLRAGLVTDDSYNVRIPCALNDAVMAL